MITSSSNQKIKEVQNLSKKAGYRKETGLFTVEGIRMFSELPEERIREIFVSASFYEKCGAETRAKIERSPHELVSDKVFGNLSDTRTPQGILAVAVQYSYTLEEILQEKACPNLLVLESIQDPGNLGTMIRAGEGAGLTGIVMDQGTADLYNPKVIRSTMGSIFRVPTVRTDRLGEAVKAMKKAGVRICAAHLKGEQPYEKLSYLGPNAFLIGNEAAGLSDDMAALADTLVKIPMCGRVESLNAAVAAAVLLYELARQRREKPES